MMNRFQMSDIDKTANIHFIGIGGISTHRKPPSYGQEYHTKNEKSIKELPLKYGEWGRIKIKLRISLERCHRIIKNLGLYSYCCKKSEYDE